MWIEWPGRGGRTDTGIDLVAKNADDGDYTAIQCKFYRADRTINKSDVEPLITASGIYTKGGPRFSKRIFVSTTDHWTTNAEESLQQEIPVVRLGAHHFENSSIDWSEFDVAQPHKNGAAQTQFSLRAPAESYHLCAGRFPETRPWKTHHGLWYREDVYISEDRGTTVETWGHHLIFRPLHHTGFSDGS